MKRSQNEDVKPYVPKRLRTKKTDEKSQPTEASIKSATSSNTENNLVADLPVTKACFVSVNSNQQDRLLQLRHV